MVLLFYPRTVPNDAPKGRPRGPEGWQRDAVELVHGYCCLSHNFVTPRPAGAPRSCAGRSERLDVSSTYQRDPTYPMTPGVVFLCPSTTIQHNHGLSIACILTSKKATQINFSNNGVQGLNTWLTPADPAWSCACTAHRGHYRTLIGRSKQIGVCAGSRSQASRGRLSRMRMWNAADTEKRPCRVFFSWRSQAESTRQVSDAGVPPVEQPRRQWPFEWKTCNLIIVERPACESVPVPNPSSANSQMPHSAISYGQTTQLHSHKRVGHLVANGNW